jgi:hypothetical protein
MYCDICEGHLAAQYESGKPGEEPDHHQESSDQFEDTREPEQRESNSPGSVVIRAAEQAK